MDTDGKFHRISCNECGASSRATFAMDACPLFFEELSKAWNTRPTPVAPVSPDATGKCGELETEFRTLSGEFVTRSQAEELLAAEREKVLFLKTAMEIAQTHCGLKDKTIDSLEADNAAKDARINFLERVAKDQETQITAQEVLEAKLAAAEKLGVRHE
ncbi:hypothetical protein C3731_20450 [Brucella oryzae]|uniref:Uncharacterized protein n=2 Tax=Brucella oryzae TaxID=335286 RepID=A0A2S7IUG9_9HYPH|nr:hypothetical protein C3731_20450 [Brucella oryzae]